VPASEFNYLRMLQAAFRPVLDWDVLESLVKQEPSLCYRLLRYLNSPAFGLLMRYGRCAMRSPFWENVRFGNGHL
jgi:EAL and modified HD-GYP domain-containing signal transduction protein